MFLFSHLFAKSLMFLFYFVSMFCGNFSRVYIPQQLVTESSTKHFNNSLAWSLEFKKKKKKIWTQQLVKPNKHYNMPENAKKYAKNSLLELLPSSPPTLSFLFLLLLMFIRLLYLFDVCECLQKYLQNAYKKCFVA